MGTMATTCMLGDACPLCIANRKGQSAHKGHRYCRSGSFKTLGRWGQDMKKPTAAAPSTAVGNLGAEDATFGFCPALLSYLRDTKYDDGSPRIPSTLSVFIEDGRWKAAVNDKDMHRSCYTAADDFEGLLKSLDTQLAADTAEWRSWGQGKGKK